MPEVFKVPIRTDIVQEIHKNVAKNKRQPNAVSTKAGEQTSAESWGTGRALARIPRVKGGGTMRSGQGAFGNMCRGGRMYAPLMVWRKIHVKSNKNTRRYAIVSCIAATAVPGLVTAKGHRINNVPEIPLVVSDKMQETTKTKEAITILKALGAYEDVERVINSHNIRCGKGKMRNRKYIHGKGPLIVYKEDKGISRAFRNLIGVDLMNVNRLNVLLLAPGSHVGRFVIWTKSAFAYLNELYGTYSTPSLLKHRFLLPRPIMENTDLHRIINSQEIQAMVTHKPVSHMIHYEKKKDLYKSENEIKKINPFENEIKEILAKHDDLQKKRELEIREAYYKGHSELMKSE